MIVQGVDLDNRGGRILGNRLDASFTGNADNRGGRIDFSGAATVHIGGDLANDAGRIDTGSLALNVGGSVFNRSLTEGVRSGITARTGDLSLDIGRDLVVTGADLHAAGKLTGFAAGDIQVGALSQTKQKKTGTSRTGFPSGFPGDSHASATETDESHQTSDLHAGGDFSLLAGGSARYQGSDIAAGGALTLGAVTGDLAVEALVARKSRHEVQTGGNVADADIRPTYPWSDDPPAAGTQRITRDRQDESVVGGKLAAGGDIALLAGRDLTLSGVDADAVGKLRAFAGRDLAARSLATTSSFAQHTENVSPSTDPNNPWAPAQAERHEQSTTVTQHGGHLHARAGIVLDAGHGSPFDAAMIADVQAQRSATTLTADLPGAAAGSPTNAPAVHAPTPRRLAPITPIAPAALGSTESNSSPAATPPTLAVPTSPSPPPVRSRSPASTSGPTAT